ncbi:MerR family transcriptional regulator [Veillonella criceti]|uniref:Multidrug-efflux transporter 1 regulator n=1 Tax=Veillonella criceti TaxID=103891 RepID=A0A380NLK1_9FIRM|nr:helix-turn-helix domain-containing protein [Veillonella criceti]SUP43817.1 Multidrug-efflux transporter 1 regulator [Veillonella criceti]
MEKFYPIGEVSKIMGVSVQTLRYYANIKLVEPQYISPNTGYRYYTYEQFHIIDRIKYLQKFGFSLNKIRGIFLRNDIDKLVTMLGEKKNSLEAQMQNLKNTIDMIQWYQNYFIHSQNIEKSCIKHIDTRYLLITKIKPHENKEDYHIRLQKLRSSERLKNIIFKRQFTLVFKYEDFISGNLTPTHIGMFIKERPSIKSQFLTKIPSGDFFCLTSRILSEECNPHEAKLYFKDYQIKPKLVLANEYEDNLYEYSQCPYEIQIFIPKNKN